MENRFEIFLSPLAAPSRDAQKHPVETENLMKTDVIIDCDCDYYYIMILAVFLMKTLRT